MGRFGRKSPKKNARTRILVEGDEDFGSGISTIFGWLEKGKQKAMENSHLKEDDNESDSMKKGHFADKMSYRGFNVFHPHPGFGRCVVRPIIQEYYPTAAALVYVFDSETYKHSDELKWTKTQLHRLRRDPNLDGAVIVVAANMSDAISAKVVEDAINKGERKKIKVFPTVAKTGEGITECFDWVVGKLNGHAQKPDAVTGPWQETVQDVTQDGKAGLNLLKAAGKSLMSKLMNGR